MSERNLVVRLNTCRYLHIVNSQFVCSLDFIGGDVIGEPHAETCNPTQCQFYVYSEKFLPRIIKGIKHGRRL